MCNKKVGHGLPVDGEISPSDTRKFVTGKHWFLAGAVAFASLLVIGVFASNGWLPSEKTT